MKAFLRWAGGKSHIINRLLPFAPETKDYERYWEPFLGSGALYFAQHPKKATLSDLNRDLVNCYKQIKKNPELIAEMLNQYSISHSRQFYLQARGLYNNAKDPVQKAALFIYLNKASFNGIFRVNKQGAYNVPYGKRDSIKIPTLLTLQKYRSLLRGAALKVGPFERILKDARKNDFVYLDPPYPPINGTSFFTHYTKERFAIGDQKRVRTVALELRRKGCLVMITNTDLPFIRDMYKGWNISQLDVTRWLTCKAAKKKIRDLIITNY